MSRYGSLRWRYLRGLGFPRVSVIKSSDGWLVIGPQRLWLGDLYQSFDEAIDHATKGTR